MGRPNDRGEEGALKAVVASGGGRAWREGGDNKVGGCRAGGEPYIL
jgi:hypothetical protein